MYRKANHELEVFLVHPGGPYWAKKDRGAWGVPKGEHDRDEGKLAAATREFQEETGFAVDPPFIELGSVTLGSGKIVTVWAFEGDCDPSRLVSNYCEIEWPPRSGHTVQIPEVDQGRWFGMGEARKRVRKEQEPLLDRLLATLQYEGPCDVGETDPGRSS